MTAGFLTATRCAVWQKTPLSSKGRGIELNELSPDKWQVEISDFVDDATVA